MDSEVERIVVEGAGALGISISGDAVVRLVRYGEMLREWNNRFNLTAITEPAEVARKHFVDSLSLLRVPESQGEGVSLVDVGSGAGFPGLPVALARPGWRVVLVDALGKRVEFLRAVALELGAQNVEAVHLRAEDAGRRPDWRERFDLATARAVAHLSVLAEFCLPLVRVGGSFLAMKGPGAAAEVENAAGALQRLGGHARGVDAFSLPGTEEGRAIIRVEKLRATPKEYPRRAGTPERRPL